MTQFAPTAPQISWCKFATIKQDLEPDEVIKALADLSNSLPTLARLELLCLSSNDKRFLGSLLYLISTPESQQILLEWADESRHAAGLARLGQACWNEQEALFALRPVEEDQRVATAFLGKLESHYLAAMAASRRALPTDATAAWIQRLRIYIVIRAIDAMEAGVPRERHLADICRTVRNACETTDHPNWSVLKAIGGGSLGFQGFIAEATVHCRSARNSSDKKSGKSFFEQLLHVLEDQGWTALPTEMAATDVQSLAPYPISTNWRAPYLDAFKTNPSSIFQAFTNAAGDGTNVTGKHRTNPKHTQAKHIHQGHGLRLEHLERSLFLPHSWHQLSKAEESALLGRISESLTSPDLAIRFGASSTFIALLCSQSMHDVAVLGVKPGESDRWHLDLENNQLVRTPPRFGRRWQHKTQKLDATSWLHPLALGAQNI